MERSIWSYGTEFVLRYFFDAETGTSGLDVTKKETGDHIGEIWGETLPDEDDPDCEHEDIELFEHRINTWLEQNFW